ncbi:MAG: UDP-N-acetylmuramoyl-L-alanine--D-glutamate ligase [Frankiales bacterium]|nr:UDP-N-acetylmuramoyl-L-alanine--D-glutamate ligase [Frankiales bacterium]
MEGRANLRKLHELGVDAAVVDRSSYTLDDDTQVLAVDSEAGRAALYDADVVVKSPGISRYDDVVRHLEQRGVEVAGGIGLWLAEAPRDRIVCITGTKGKSTTTSIAGSLIRGLGHRCFVGGNLGAPPWDPEANTEVDYWVIEVSSYQATDVRIGPRVVAVTSLSQDHLSWHGNSVHNYYRDKLSLCTAPGVERVVANGEDVLLRAHSALLGPSVEWVAEMPGNWAAELQLLGEHNLRNAAVARRALVALGVAGAADDRAVADAAVDYEPLPSRLTMVGSIGGVDFVDDSLSTNVLPTLAAVDAFPNRRVALLVGGFERGIDYEPLADGLVPRADDVLVLAMPDNGPRIAAALRSVAGTPPVVECEDIAVATTRGYEWAQPAGVVLLSPAAPSFGRYLDYRARAAAFEEAMRGITSA